jgi:hypothetical protein
MKDVIIVRPIKRAEVTAVQSVFNDKAIIEGLGGFTMEETIKTSAFNQRPGLWAAFLHDTPLGAFMAGGRPQIHLMKYGSVGILPEYRRNRISTALYLACTMQGVIEGRRLFEDTIVGDNEIQHSALPKMGLDVSGTLKHRTASGKDIMLYQASFVDSDPLIAQVLRSGESTFRFEFYLDNNPITRDWYVKNEELAGKHPRLAESWDKIGRHREGLLQGGGNVHVITDRALETAPQRGQKKIHPDTPALWEGEQANV